MNRCRHERRRLRVHWQEQTRRRRRIGEGVTFAEGVVGPQDALQRLVRIKVRCAWFRAGVRVVFAD